MSFAFDNEDSALSRKEIREWLAGIHARLAAQNAGEREAPRHNPDGSNPGAPDVSGGQAGSEKVPANRWESAVTFAELAPATTPSNPGRRHAKQQAPRGRTQPMSVAVEEVSVVEPTKPLLNREEMARYLGWSVSTLTRVQRTHGFPVSRAGRVVQYPWREVLDFVIEAARAGRDLHTEPPKRGRK